ncbi:hypothetical protein ACFL1E_02755 [Candidatus Omnitrophota bacterium]
MKTIFLFVVLTLYIGINCYAQNKQIQFRLVLSEDEIATKDHDQYSFAVNENSEPKDMYVDKEVLLSNSDIEKIIITSETFPVYGAKSIMAPKGNEDLTSTFQEIIIEFKPESAKKLEEVTRNNLKRQMAIISDENVLMAPRILQPITEGTVQISGGFSESKENAIAFVKELGFEPEFE